MEPQLDHFFSELFKIYLIGTQRAIPSIERLFSGFSQKKASMADIFLQKLWYFRVERQVDYV